jgi:F-type H+-transporting ATPase subunit epsilon
MPGTLHLEVVAAAGTIFSGEVESVVIPAARGSMGILRGHAPFLGLLSAGTIVARPSPVSSSPPGPEPLSFPVTSGFARVLLDQVLILADGVGMG